MEILLIIVVVIIIGAIVVNVESIFKIFSILLSLFIIGVFFISLFFGMLMLWAKLFG